MYLQEVIQEHGFRELKLYYLIQEQIMLEIYFKKSISKIKNRKLLFRNKKDDLQLGKN